MQIRNIARLGSLDRFGGSTIKRSIVLAVLATMLASFGVAYTAITATDLAPTPGDENIQLALNSFVADPDTTLTNSDVSLVLSTAAAAGDSAPGIEATLALPAVNNALTAGNYAYTFEVTESGITTWGVGEDVRIRIYSTDGGTTTLAATLYAQQAVLDDANIDGVTVTIDLASSTQIPDSFDIIVDRQ